MIKFWSVFIFMCAGFLSGTLLSVYVSMWWIILVVAAVGSSYYLVFGDYLDDRKPKQC